MPNASPTGVIATFERVAHRGAPRERVENTLPGFLLALEHGADAVELDVHVTADGVVVVHHDDQVHGHLIAQSTWPDVSTYDVGGGAAIPRLEDVLEAVGDRANVYVELKGYHMEERVIAVARKHGQRFALHSFDHAAIARVAELAPDVPRGILFDRGVANPLEQLRSAIEATRPRDVWPHWTLVQPDFTRLAAELGTRVIAWTVNSEEIARNVLAAGVAGICTDDVRLLSHL